MRETYAPVLLKSKAARLSVERSNRLLVAKGDSGLTPTALFARSIVRPVEMPVFSSIVLALCIFSALEVGLTHLPFTTFPSVFQEQYGFTTGITGLSYLGLGIGMTFGLALFNVFSGRMLKTRAGRAVMKPEYRLSRMVYFTPIPHVVFLWYGWSANAEVHLIVPILGTPVIGLGSLLVIMLAQSYFVDAFGPYAASALAMKLILLSLFLTSSLLAGPYLYNSRRRMGG